MSKIMLLVCFFGFGKFCIAQCSKSSILTSSKTEYLDAGYTLQRTVEESSIVEISKSQIIITPGNDERKMTGVIKADSCVWTKSYREGRAVYKALFSRDGDADKNVTVIIEGKDGRISFLMEVEGMPDRKIRLIADKFEEKK